MNGYISLQLSILVGVCLHFGSPFTCQEVFEDFDKPPTDESSTWLPIMNVTREILDLSIRIEKDRLSKMYEVQELIRELDSRIGWPRSSKDGFDKGKHPSSIANMEHPVKAFVILNRFLLAKDLMKPTLDNDEFESILSNTNVPSREDLVACGEALLRLQAFYRLNLDDIIRGIVRGQQNGLSNEPIMGPSECLELGKIAYYSGDYSMATVWFQKSFELFTVNKIVDLNELLEYMAFAAYKTNRIRRAAQITKLWLEREPDNDRAQGNLEYYEDELRQHESTMEESSRSIDDDDLAPLVSNGSDYDRSYAELYSPEKSFSSHNYDNVKDEVVRYLCTEESETSKSDFLNTCTRSVSFAISPYISPEIKIETLNDSPRIIRIYDILTDNEANHIRRLASSRLERSTVKTKDGLTTSDFRIAKTAWLSEESDEIVDRLERRIRAITDIDMSDSEDLQVVNYGAGGFYGPHTDSASPTLPMAASITSMTEIDNKFNDSIEIETNSLLHNDRMATVLIYLNHVQAGGSTVFPKLNLTVKPIERSAVVWFNLLKNGYTDIRTLHTGCPVLLGSKWIATKWAREADNIFSRPCGLRSSE